MEKSVVKNSIFNVGHKVLNVFFPLITSMYVSRILGPEGVGRVAYAQNVLSYFLVFASVGIPVYGIKEIARRSNYQIERNRAFTELVTINAVTTTFCILAYILLVFAIPDFRLDSVLFFVVGISLYLNYFNIDWFFAGIEEYVYITIRSTFIKICAVIALFLFVRTREDVLNYAIVTAIGLSANYLLNVINIRNRVAISFEGLNIKKHIRPVIILSLTMLATDLYNQVDITMMGFVCSKAEIGCYSYSIKIVRIVTSIAVAISATMLPRLSRYYSEKRFKDFQDFLGKILETVIILVAPCITVCVLCTANIITVLYGNEFVGSISLIKILSPIILIISVSYLYGSITLTAINKEKYLLFATIAGAAVNIILNAFLIPRFHGTGAAFASVIAEFVVLFLHCMFAYRFIHFTFVSSENGKTVISTIFMVVSIIIVQSFIDNPFINLFISAFCGTVVFLFVLYLLKHRIVLEGMKRVMNRKISKS